MILLSSFFIGFILVNISPVKSIDTSVKGDRCSNHDLCSASKIDAFRTCSCEDDCYMYGICCVDADNFDLMSAHKTEYECHDDRTVTPVFVKRTCAEEFVGHVDHQKACMDAESDKKDVLGNLLVTSIKTKITYRNNDCAICNNEVKNDLRSWTVQMTCPSVINLANHKRIRINERDIRQNLTFHKDVEEWGLQIYDEFINCSISFYQPSEGIGRLMYCAPNMISNCPLDYADDEVVKSCTTFHGERKLKNASYFFKNVHCAFCNGALLKQLDCVGRNYAPIRPQRGHNVIKVIFNEWEWSEIVGMEKYKCSEAFSYDPFRSKCRKDNQSPEKVPLTNSAPKNTVALLTLVIFTFVTNKILS